MYKLRTIVYSKKGVRDFDVKGLTVPSEIAIHFEGVFFNVEKSGCSILFTSGCPSNPTKQEVDKYKFQDCII